MSFRIYKKQYGLAIQYFDIFANYLQKIALFYFLRTKMFFFFAIYRPISDDSNISHIYIYLLVSVAKTS